MKNKFPIIDLHQDILLHLNRREYFGEHYQTDFDMLVKNGISLVVATSFPVPSDGDHFSLEMNNQITKDLKEYRDVASVRSDIKIVDTKADVETILEIEEITGILPHIEGLNAFTDKKTLLESLDTWHKLGLRSVGIVWNLDNICGGGSEGDVKNGLTDIGRSVFDWALDSGVVIDMAHMNQKTFFDSADYLKSKNRPLYVSHGGLASITPELRNYTDEQLKLVAETGGTFGIFFSNKFMSTNDQSTIDDVLKHIDHAVKVMGINHVSIGSDFGGLIHGLIKDLDSVNLLSNVFSELSNRGYADNDIEKIAFKNAQRVLLEYLK